MLLTVPVFRALRENFPDAHISALVNSGMEDVLKGNPLIKEVLSLNRDLKKLSACNRYLKEIDFLKQIRKERFDMTVDLTGGDRAAVISFISGAKYRLGWKSSKGLIGKRYLYTHLSEPDSRKHMVLQNLEVVSRFGINTDNLSVDFYIPDDDRAFIKNILEENGVRESDTVVHVHPTSRWLFKCWRDEYIAEVIMWLIEKGVKVIVTSSPDRREMEKVRAILSLVSSRITHYASRLIDLCGKTSIKQLGAVARKSKLFFGVDSAPMHIAAAVGTPVVALFGPSGAFHWGPWDNNYSSEFGVMSSEFKNQYPNRNGIQIFGSHTVIQRDWECIPCGKDGCNGSKISKCLEDIAVDEVKKIIERYLAGL